MNNARFQSDNNYLKPINRGKMHEAPKSLPENA